MVLEDIFASLPNFLSLHAVLVCLPLCVVFNSNSLFLPSPEQWHELPNFPNPNKWGYSLVSLNNDVYVTGE